MSLFCARGNITHHVDEELRASGHNHIIPVHIADENVHASITPSVNTLALENPEIYRLGDFRYYEILIYNISLFIEYEYQA